MDKQQQQQHSRTSNATKKEGCEDMVIDHAASIVYMACASVSNRVKWWPPVNHYDHHNVTDEQDPIFIYDLKTGEIQPLPVSGFNGELRLHGIALWKSGADGLAAKKPLTAADEPAVLMLVNHGRNGSTIEIFEHILPSEESATLMSIGELRHVETVKDPLIRTPNSVYPISRRSFYVTNDHKFARGFMRIIEEFVALPLGEVVFRNEHGITEVVASNIPYANGITGYRNDQYLLVVSANLARVYIYERATKYDNKLIFHGYVSTGFSGDNIHVDHTSGHVYMAGTLQPLKIVERFNDPSVDAASQAARLDNIHIGNKAKHELPSVDVKPLLIYDKYPGSALTVAAVDSNHHKMLLGGFFNEGILVCDLV
ncbi:hypothetical protein BDF22DRAFT_657308 [Syncephalis plumigaleata]|nr:hypothetical protein BDF22DRAFT_657308 [Syncephalis plumigaleata]